MFLSWPKSVIWYLGLTQGTETRNCTHETSQHQPGHGINNSYEFHLSQLYVKTEGHSIV